MISTKENIKQKSTVDKNVSKTTQNVVQHFYEQEKQMPYRTAIIEKGQSITFIELKRNVLKTAQYFESKGIGKGDRVLVFVPVSISLYRIVLALFHIGATAVFLDEWSSKDRLKKACEIADCKAFVGNWKAKAMAIFMKPLRDIPVWLSAKKMGKVVKSNKPVEVNSNDTALITFTTGSTGIPKAADRTHHFLYAQRAVLSSKLAPKAGMVDMAALPIFVLLNLGDGLTSILPDANMRKPKSIKMDKVVAQLNVNKVERIIASPFLIKGIAEYLIQHKMSLPFLGEVYTGGAPIFPNDAALFLEAFGNIRLEAVYGSTEAEPISSISMQELAQSEIVSGLPVGIVSESTNLKIISYRDAPIVGEGFASAELATGEVGEIVVSGEHVLKGYVNNPGAILRNKIDHHGTIWHRTGDAGYVDESGQLFLVGRCAQLIYKCGKRYSPFLYEYLLQKIDGVSMGTILMIDDQLCAVLDSKNELTQETIAGIFEKEDVRIINVDKIPRDPRHQSKIDYQVLRETIKLKR